MKGLISKLRTWWMLHPFVRVDNHGDVGDVVHDKLTAWYAEDMQLAKQGYRVNHHRSAMAGDIIYQGVEMRPGDCVVILDLSYNWLIDAHRVSQISHVISCIYDYVQKYGIQVKILVWYQGLVQTIGLDEESFIMITQYAQWYVESAQSGHIIELMRYYEQTYEDGHAILISDRYGFEMSEQLLFDLFQGASIAFGRNYSDPRIDARGELQYVNWL